MAMLPSSHSEKEKKTTAPPTSPRLSVVREESSASEMAGRDLGAAPAAGARMNKCKIVNIAVVSVLAVLLLMAALVSLARYMGRKSFLKFCVITHVTTIFLLAWFAVTAPTPASRRSYAKAAVRSFVHLALNLFLVFLAEVEDTA